MTQIHGTSVEAQLIALYEERERLAETLGVSDAQSLIDMVRSLESQLQTLYEDRESRGGPASVVFDAPAESEAAALDTPAEPVAPTEPVALPAVVPEVRGDLARQHALLERELGCSGAEAIVSMVRSLEMQLRSVYEDREANGMQAATVVAQIREIADEIGNDFRETELVYENEQGPTRWAVTWRHA